MSRTLALVLGAVGLPACSLDIPIPADPLAGSVGLYLQATDGIGSPLTLVPGQLSVPI